MLKIKFTQKLVSSKLVSVVAIASLLMISSCEKIATLSSVKSVDIPQTPVKDQNSIGFCWSYATMGFLETLLLKKTGQSIDLSEEALGFYRMAQELGYLSTKYTSEELADEKMIEQKAFEGLEGWDLTFNPVYNPDFQSRNALELVRRRGVVPEYAWSFKILDDNQRETFFKTIFSGFAALMKEHGQRNVTSDMILELLASPGAYGSKPPTSFNYVLPNGVQKSMTAQDFAANVVGFTPDDYTYMIPQGKIDYSKMVTAIKLTLARGINVPLSYTIYDKSENDWDASYSAKNIDVNDLKSVGGHAVLITDFVNQGGRPGAIPTSDLKVELEKTPNELDFVVIKNSWDTIIQSPLLRLPGYFTMDQSYLQLISRNPEDFAIVVPRDIAFQVRYND